MDNEQKLKIRQYAVCPVEQIAEKVGATVDEVVDFLKQTGYSDSQIKHESPKKRGGKTTPLSEEVKAKVVELRENGVTISQVAEQLGIGKSTINRIMANHKAESVESVPVQPEAVETVESAEELKELADGVGRVRKMVDKGAVKEQFRLIKYDFDCVKNSVAKDSSTDDILDSIFRLGSLEEESAKLYLNNTGDVISEQEAEAFWENVDEFKEQLFDMVKNAIVHLEAAEEDDTLDRLRIINNSLGNLKKSTEKDKSVDNILHALYRLGSVGDECYGLFVNSTEQEVADTYYDILEFKANLFDLIKKEPAPSANGTSSEVSNDTVSNVDYTAKFQKCQGAVERIRQSLMEIYGCMEEEKQLAFDFGEIHQQVKDTCLIFEEE